MDMAWRPNRFLIEGMLDNRKLGKVTGWMRFTGLKSKVTFDLEGDFHRDIRGAKIRFTGYADGDVKEAAEYMKPFARHQTGKVGDMTAGFPPADYIPDSVYIEWFGEENGRVVIELEQDKLELRTKPISASKTKPISRQQQAHNMGEFLDKLARDCNIPAENAICVGGSKTIRSKGKQEVSQ